jgi:hypothetical protein
MLAEGFEKEDGIQLAIGGGKWYLFYADQKDFFEKHHWHEIRRMNGVLWWRNIGRLVFIKDVHAYVRLRNNKRADQRKSRVVAIK